PPSTRPAPWPRPRSRHVRKVRDNQCLERTGRRRMRRWPSPARSSISPAFATRAFAASPRVGAASMAVPKRKTSPSRRGMRRSADALAQPTYVEDKDSGELRRPHHIDLKTGMYRGRQVLKPKKEA